MGKREEYMRRAIELAEKGKGRTSPNPLVGCVIVKNGEIIGEGYHEYYGGLHAERNALKNCTESPEGADLYVTLEPCCHYGKTPPCTEAIIENGIRRVFVGCKDPNPLVGGKGIKILKNAEIEVYEDILKSKCMKQNEVFFSYIREKKPFVVMKYAMTLDGKIASHTGDSKWVTGEKAREHVHYLRDRYMGIMAGIGTVLADNPTLNCRIEKGNNPIRIICDTELKIPLESELVKTAGEIPLIVGCGVYDDEKEKLLSEKGVRIIHVDRSEKGIDLKQLITILGEEGIDSILLEGGGSLNETALREGLVDKVICYMAPKIIGGKDAKTPVEGRGIEMMRDAVILTDISYEIIDGDICISGYVRR